MTACNRLLLRKRGIRRYIVEANDSRSANLSKLRVALQLCAAFVTLHIRTPL